MNKATMVLTGVGVGAGLMYILDPDRGGRRRAHARDRASTTWNRASGLSGDAWSPSTRIVAAALGGGLAIYGYRRGGLLGKTATALGMGLLTRGIMNESGPLGTGPFGRLGDKVASLVGSGIESVAGQGPGRRPSPSVAYGD